MCPQGSREVFPNCPRMWVVPKQERLLLGHWPRRLSGPPLHPAQIRSWALQTVGSVQGPQASCRPHSAVPLGMLTTGQGWGAPCNSCQLLAFGFRDNRWKVEGREPEDSRKAPWKLVGERMVVVGGVAYLACPGHPYSAPALHPQAGPFQPETSSAACLPHPLYLLRNPAPAIPLMTSP